MLAKRIWDITPLVTKDFPVWPMSEPLHRTVVCDIDKGNLMTVSNLSATAHLGAHVDAPSHYANTGRSIDECSLNYYLGPCQVIHAPVAKSQAIREFPLNKMIRQLKSKPHSFFWIL